ncbi:MAG: undecaprenyl-diphosphate phosphatase [Desulfobacterales bacterium]
MLQSAILGVIQGLTEFIPISSSAHLVVVPWLFGWGERMLNSLTFDVALHLGTLIAVLSYFAADWVRLIKAGLASIAERRIGGDPDRRMAWFLIIGTIPGGVVGLLAESTIEELFHRPGVPIEATSMIALAVVLALLGVFLLLAERMAGHLRTMDQLSLKEVLLIGMAQALAIFPGVSRSGATITAGLALGLKREAAARFSFLLSAPIIGGAGAKSLWTIVRDIHAHGLGGFDVVAFAGGFLAAAVSGYLCIKYLLRFLAKHPVTVFVLYRWALAALIIAVVVARG